MTYEDLQKAHDEETPEDYEDDDKCTDCGQRKCICDKLYRLNEQ